MKKVSVIIGVVAAVACGFLIFLASWDPPAPSQDIEKQMPDDIFEN